MAEDKSITKWFGDNLAKLLADKIKNVYKDFDSDKYVKTIKLGCKNLSYTKRIELHADVLQELLPQSYPKAIKILVEILGNENPKETGMFTDFYWVMPIGKFVENYGLGDFDISIQAIEEITKRNTGEYAIRPFIRKYPQKTIKLCKNGQSLKIFIFVDYLLKEQGRNYHGQQNLIPLLKIQNQF
jgi:hypothetical protein